MSNASEIETTASIAAGRIMNILKDLENETGLQIESISYTHTEGGYQYVQIDLISKISATST